jgi:hypothetical protein
MSATMSSNSSSGLRFNSSGTAGEVIRRNLGGARSHSPARTRSLCFEIDGYLLVEVREGADLFITESFRNEYIIRGIDYNIIIITMKQLIL